MQKLKENFPLISVQSVEEISVDKFNVENINLIKKKYAHLRQKSKGP